MSERLNYSFHSETKDPDLETQKKEFDFLEYPVQKVYEDEVEYLGTEQLEKTKFERKITLELLSAAEKVLQEMRLGNIGKSITLRLEDIHILDQQELERVFGENGSAPACHYIGNVYVARQQNVAEFICELSHEIAHKISALDVSFKHENTELKLKTKKSGFLEYGDGTDESRFGGVMEAVNELLGKKIRKKFLESNRDFNDKKEKKYIEKTATYWPQIRVLYRILEDVTSSEKERDTIVEQLIKDHVIGKSVFLHNLQAKYPKEYLALQKMDTSDESALQVALELGYLDVAQEISDG